MTQEHDDYVISARPYVLRDKAELYRRLGAELKEAQDALDSARHNQLGEVTNIGQAFIALRLHLDSTSRRAKNTQIKLEQAAKAWAVLADTVEHLLAAQRPVLEAFDDALGRLAYLKRSAQPLPAHLLGNSHGPGGVAAGRHDQQVRDAEADLAAAERKLAGLMADYHEALAVAKPHFAKFWHIEHPKVTLELPNGIPHAPAGPGSGNDANPTKPVAGPGGTKPGSKPGSGTTPEPNPVKPIPIPTTIKPLPAHPSEEQVRAWAFATWNELIQTTGRPPYLYPTYDKWLAFVLARYGFGDAGLYQPVDRVAYLPDRGVSVIR